MKETVQLNDELLTGLQKQLERTNSEKQQLKDKLEVLTNEMNQFTYIVSHDLQAPLRMVTGFMELLEKKHADKLDAAARQYIDYAVKGAVKMKDLVFDLLEYSRLSSIENELVEVDLNCVMQEIHERLSTVIRETKANITIEQLPVVTGDKKKLAQLMYHLVDNALKYRSEAVPDIRLSCKKENGFWIICIADNGLGINTAFFERVFQVFRRLHNDDAKYKGTGIGLALCKKIVELHGGVINVESEIGKGSFFYFSLPVNV